MNELDNFLKRKENELVTLNNQVNNKIKNLENKIKIINSLKEKYPDLNYFLFSYKRILCSDSIANKINCVKIEEPFRAVHVNLFLNEQTNLDNKIYKNQIYYKPGQFKIATFDYSLNKYIFTENLFSLFDEFDQKQKTKIEVTLKKFLNRSEVLRKTEMSSLPKSLQTLFTFL
jgi:hypothetical protein